MQSGIRQLEVQEFWDHAIEFAGREKVHVELSFLDLVVILFEGSEFE